MENVLDIFLFVMILLGIAENLNLQSVYEAVLWSFNHIFARMFKKSEKRSRNPLALPGRASETMKSIVKMILVQKSV